MSKSPVDFVGVSRQLLAAGSVDDALAIIQAAYPVNFVTYHLVSTIVSDIDAPFVRTTYPQPWVSRYLLRGYVRIDPVVQEGFLRQLPFDWRELQVSPEALTFLEDARNHGVGSRGLSIPITDKVGRRAILSLNAETSPGNWDDIIRSCLIDWTELAHLVHKTAIFEIHGENDPVPALTARERDCPYWSALGKDYKDIALILGLSHHTTRSYIKSARSKLGCATVSAAAALALKLRLIVI